VARFSGKRAVITGAASGVGAAVARAMAAEGAAGLALIDQNEAAVTAIAPEIGPRASSYGCDVSDAAAVAAVWTTVASWEALDVLVTADPRILGRS
jgi:NAD(P)-dependent dehydrogenase (short-subunit alcohol dehydrogenase family)